MILIRMRHIVGIQGFGMACSLYATGLGVGLVMLYIRQKCIPQPTMYSIGFSASSQLLDSSLVA